MLANFNLRNEFYSREEIRKSLHGFGQKFVAADGGSLILIKTEWSAKIDKLEQSGVGLENRKSHKN